MFNRKLGLYLICCSGVEKTSWARLGHPTHTTHCLFPSQREQPPAATHSPPHNNGEHKIAPAPAPHKYTKTGTAMTTGQRGLTAGSKVPSHGRLDLEPTLPSILWSWGVAVSA